MHQNKKIKVLVFLILVIIILFSVVITKKEKKDLSFIVNTDTKKIASYFLKNNLTKIDSGLNSENIKDEFVLYENTESQIILLQQNNEKILSIREPNNKDSFYGLSIGDSLETVVEKNGKHFYFYGFEWEGSGQLVGWNQGYFNSDKISVKLKIDSDYNNYVISNLLGTDIISSKDIDSSEVTIVIEEIDIKL